MKVSVIGAGGYAGGELLRLLSQHPEVTDLVAVSRSQAGRPIADSHPALATLDLGAFSDAAPGAAAAGRDVVFLALEHGESSRQAAEIFSAGPGLVVDLAADFRVRDATLYERHYGRHEAPAFRGRFVYGLADICGESLRGTTAIASPGCFATAAALALYPLARHAHDAAPALFAITGSSGAGISPKPTTHHPARAHNVFAYGVLGHRHDAEIVEQWRGWSGSRASPRAEPRLIVHAGPFVRGIYLTMHARIEPAGNPAEWYETAYAGRPFIRLSAHPPELTHVVGTNDAILHAAVSTDGTELQVSVAIDNLVKGAAGQAIQSMNLALGLAEAAGLRQAAIYPC
ncbi:MAG TPA: N-acetyl-gamma-glutamyl-phosphate reductase [Gemmatimonadales bacterium]|nr:N-acetyl-gamma-glutamyl-phosphate reductase [Gemmatimonadales bacterium]